MSDSFVTVIHQKVARANAGQLPEAIVRLKAGWVIAHDRPVVRGYCLLLSDPVVSSLNELSLEQRAQYALDMIRVGDALIAICGAERINYETWCNVDPALHTHIVPRYAAESRDKRVLPVCRAYDSRAAGEFDPNAEADFMQRMRQFLKNDARS